MGILESEVSRVFEMPDGEKVTVSQEDIINIFKGFRPRLMDVKVFRYIQKIIRTEVKRHLKGEMVHLSKVSDEVWANYTAGKRKIKQRGFTYRKNRENEK